MDEQSTAKVRPHRVRKEVARALGAFSPLERLIFMIILGIGAVSVLLLLNRINENFLVSIPMQGGTLSEGVVGTPRFVNPLLAASDADHDLTALVYRGLMRKNSAGDLVPDLAKSFTVSNDGLTYTFTLGDAVFQDGTKVTSDDVLFTIKSAQDPLLKSAERVRWEGVLVKAADEHTVTFTLKQPYAPFLANTTLGILPKHIWSTIATSNWAYSDHNTKNAVGEGPFRVKNVSQNSSGIPSSYELSAVRNKNSQSPLIDTIRMHFYANEEALVAAYESGAIDTLGGLSPENTEKLAKEGAHVTAAPLPRVFGLFFNQSQAKIFTDIHVRDAIATAIDKDAIIAEVLKGYGSAGNGPIPENTGLTESQKQIGSTSGDPARAKSILEKDGWKMGSDGIYTKQVSKKETARLSFEIATNDTPELTQATNLIASDLKAAGIEALPKVYETGSLNQDIIRPRKFQALFFGQVVSSQSDVYAFWHSSQRTDPGLNIAGYANAKVDKLLETGISTLDPAKTSDIYSSLASEISADIPAVFVYSPSYVYIVRPGLSGITLSHISAPEDRFADINTWYLATDRVWKIFAKN